MLAVLRRVLEVVEHWPSHRKIGPLMVPPFLAQKHGYREGATPSDRLASATLIDDESRMSSSKRSALSTDSIGYFGWSSLVTSRDSMPDARPPRTATGAARAPARRREPPAGSPSGASGRTGRDSL